MQGLADGYFVIPYTLSSYLATQKPDQRPKPSHLALQEADEPQLWLELLRDDCAIGYQTPVVFENQLN